MLWVILSESSSFYKGVKIHIVRFDTYQSLSIDHHTPDYLASKVTINQNHAHICD